MPGPNTLLQTDVSAVGAIFLPKAQTLVPDPAERPRIGGVPRTVAFDRETADLAALHRPIKFILGVSAAPGAPEFAPEALQRAPWSQRQFLANLLSEVEPGCLSERQLANARRATRVATVALSIAQSISRHFQAQYGMIHPDGASAWGYSRNR